MKSTFISHRINFKVSSTLPFHYILPPSLFIFNKKKEREREKEIEIKEVQEKRQFSIVTVFRFRIGSFIALAQTGVNTLLVDGNRVVSVLKPDSWVSIKRIRLFLSSIASLQCRENFLFTKIFLLSERERERERERLIH